MVLAEVFKKKNHFFLLFIFILWMKYEGSTSMHWHTVSFVFADCFFQFIWSATEFCAWIIFFIFFCENEFLLEKILAAFLHSTPLDLFIWSFVMVDSRLSMACASCWMGCSECKVLMYYISSCTLSTEWGHSALVWLFILVPDLVMHILVNYDRTTRQISLDLKCLIQWYMHPFFHTNSSDNDKICFICVCKRELIQAEGTKKDRGRPKITIIEVLKKDMSIKKITGVWLLIE